MRKLIVFESISVDGYFTQADGGNDFAHRRGDPEFDAFAPVNASKEGELVFGRVTYEEMVAFWPTPAAAAMMPEVARAMNARRKSVFSRSWKSSDWNTTRVFDDAVGTVRRWKGEDGPDLVVLGSGGLVAQLVGARLV